ncbi:MAG: hypothetical protein GY835_17440 [bacterium]|nr:hypothetical protein [bacterium]
MAERFLALSETTILERNLQVGQKEIDLLALEGDCLVFVEVKLRRSQRYGDALDSLSRLKLKRLKAALRVEVQRREWTGFYRLDFIAIDVRDDQLHLERYRGL